jgi:hypothetical protein
MLIERARELSEREGEENQQNKKLAQQRQQNCLNPNLNSCHLRKFAEIPASGLLADLVAFAFPHTQPTFHFLLGSSWLLQRSDAGRDEEPASLMTIKKYERSERRGLANNPIILVELPSLP